MSIIFDALQKTQKIRSDVTEKRLRFIKPNRRVVRWTGIGLLGVTGLSLLVISGIYAAKHLFKHPAPKPHPIIRVAKVLPPPPPKRIIKTIYVKLYLTGVFLSDNDKIAMINNRMYHLGETLYGMKIVKIDFEAVRLEGQQRTLVLKVMS